MRGARVPARRIHCMFARRGSTPTSRLGESRRAPNPRIRGPHMGPVPARDASGSCACVQRPASRPLGGTADGAANPNGTTCPAAKHGVHTSAGNLAGMERAWRTLWTGRAWRSGRTLRGRSGRAWRTLRTGRGRTGPRGPGGPSRGRTLAGADLVGLAAPPAANGLAGVPAPAVRGCVRQLGGYQRRERQRRERQRRE